MKSQHMDWHPADIVAGLRKKEHHWLLSHVKQG